MKIKINIKNATREVIETAQEKDQNCDETINFKK